MRVTLHRGIDSLETLVLHNDHRELALVLDAVGPCAVIERDAERCVSVEPTADQGRVRARVAAFVDPCTQRCAQ